MVKMDVMQEVVRSPPPSRLILERIKAEHDQMGSLPLLASAAEKASHRSLCLAAELCVVCGDRASGKHLKFFKFQKEFDDFPLYFLPRHIFETSC